MWEIQDFTSNTQPMCSGNFKQQINKNFLFTLHLTFKKNIYSPQKVRTSKGLLCEFPFTYNGISYSSCTIKGPNNGNSLPQCITSAGTWDFCNGKSNK